MTGSACWRITTPRVTEREGWCEVRADVAGAPVWFRTQSGPLEALPEAFAAAFFLPALQHGALLESEVPLAPEWLSSVNQLLPIFHQWWGLPRECPIAATPQSLPQTIAGGETPPPALGQCFSGGVDSFYSLLRGLHDPQCLVFIRGFDVSLTDKRRFQAVETSLQAIAQATGKRAVIMHTNLREHPVFRQSSWDRSHGAALASVGLVLSAQFGNLVIPSSYPYRRGKPWGSHWDTDPHWSYPGRMQIIHDDATAVRYEKVAAIANEPLAQHHLRVCWANRAATGNCSGCEKCLRTMVQLALVDALPAFERVFDVQTPLHELIDRLPVVPELLLETWGELGALAQDPGLQQAIHRVMRRSGTSTGGRLLRILHRTRRTLRRATTKAGFS